MLRQRYGLKSIFSERTRKKQSTFWRTQKSYIDIGQKQYNQTLYVNENEVDYDENGKIIFARATCDEFKD